jgi:hypothetical protein
MVTIDLFALLFFTVAFSTTITLVISFVVSIFPGRGEMAHDSRGSFGSIVIATSVSALVMGGAIWIDGIPNNPSILPTCLLSVALAGALVTAGFCGRLIGLVEEARRNHRAT